MNTKINKLYELSKPGFDPVRVLFGNRKEIYIQLNGRLHLITRDSCSEVLKDARENGLKIRREF